MRYEQIAREKLERLRDDLCMRYFTDIDYTNVSFDVEITADASQKRVYLATYKDSLGSGYCIEAGLPCEILNNEPSFQTLFTAGLAHELGHIVKRHPGSFRAGLAVSLDILGRELSPLRKLGRFALQRIEEEADSVVRERGLGPELEAGIVLGKKMNA